MARINTFAENIVATMTEAVLSKIDLPSRDVLANIRNLTQEVRTLGNTLREINVRENPVAHSRIEQLLEALTALNASVDRLANSRTILTDEAIGQLSRAVTDNLTRMDVLPTLAKLLPIGALMRPKSKLSSVRYEHGRKAHNHQETDSCPLRPSSLHRTVGQFLGGRRSKLLGSATNKTEELSGLGSHNRDAPGSQPTQRTRKGTHESKGDVQRPRLARQNR